MNGQRLTFGRGMKAELAEAAIANMRENCKRTLPWFIGNVAREGELIPVAGGPSLRTRLHHVRKRQQDGGCVVALNGAGKLLRENGIQPDVVMFLDVSEAVCAFIPDEPDSALYLVASSCHPKVLDKLQGRKVVLWHQAFGDGGKEEQDEILDAYPEKPSVLIGGGSTAGLRILNVGYLLGFRTFHFYGLDSSYADDGADHAYTKHDGPEPSHMTIVQDGKRYRVSPWMARQGEEFKEFYQQFRALGCKIAIHGEGLIPDIWREMNKAIRKAA